MDRERLFRHLEQRYSTKRDMIARIPLGAQADALWQEPPYSHNHLHRSSAILSHPLLSSPEQRQRSVPSESAKRSVKNPPQPQHRKRPRHIAVPGAYFTTPEDNSQGIHPPSPISPHGYGS